MRNIHKKFYDDPKGNASFERCVDVMTDLIGKENAELKEANADLKEKSECFKKRKACGRQRHNAKWMAIYNDFVVCHEQGMTMVEIAKCNGISEQSIYRYKAYYDEMQKKKKGKS